ncbi:MAG: hypothetical protein ACLFN4_07320 [Candidatus Acetothermia bacterium]
MGLFDLFSSKEDEEEDTGSIRYLCRLQTEYDQKDVFLEDFFDIVGETIKKYNQSNPVQAEELNRDQAYKAGGRWIYEANIEQVEEEKVEEEVERGSFVTRGSTFKVIAREQPHFGIELSGDEGLITPFLDELEQVLEEQGFEFDVTVVAKPGSGKAVETGESESA